MKNSVSGIRVFLCDDHKLFRQGVSKLLAMEKDIVITGEASNGSELVESIKKTGTDIVLMDISMPNMDGVAATKKLQKALPDTRIIILTVHEDEAHIFEAIKAGALGYLLKDVSIDDLLKAIRSVYKGEALIQPVIATKILKEFPRMSDGNVRRSEDKYYDLTDKEKEVLNAIKGGLTNKEIANNLKISEKTVKNHVRSIFQTLHVSNRTKAALYVIDKL